METIRCNGTLALAIANTRDPNKPIVFVEGEFKGEWRWTSGIMTGFERSKSPDNGSYPSNLIPPSRMYAAAGSAEMVFENHRILPFANL